MIVGGGLLGLNLELQPFDVYVDRKFKQSEVYGGGARFGWPCAAAWRMTGPAFEHNLMWLWRGVAVNSGIALAVLCIVAIGCELSIRRLEAGQRLNN